MTDWLDIAISASSGAIAGGAVSYFIAPVTAARSERGRVGAILKLDAADDVTKFRSRLRLDADAHLPSLSGMPIVSVQSREHFTKTVTRTLPVLGPLRRRRVKALLRELVGPYLLHMALESAGVPATEITDAQYGGQVERASDAHQYEDGSPLGLLGKLHTERPDARNVSLTPNDY